MKIGIDFDNTIIDYGKAFHKYAVVLYGMPESVIKDKATIRSYFWSLPSGNAAWTELQGIIYGEKILEADMSPGLDSFLIYCKNSGISICIISHKTEFPASGPRKNLRSAAKDWMEVNGLFNKSQYAIDPAAVFFESTRCEKVSRISSEKCSLFIDDLPEVFNEKGFPVNVDKVLYSSIHLDAKDVTVIGDWCKIEEYVRVKINCAEVQ